MTDAFAAEADIVLLLTAGEPALTLRSFVPPDEVRAMSSAGMWCTVTWVDNGDGAVSVTAKGEVDVATAPELARVLGEAAEAADRILVLDMAEVTFMDAAGLRVLVDALAETTERGAELRLDPISRPVLRLLEVAGVIDQFRPRAAPPAGG